MSLTVLLTERKPFGANGRSSQPTDDDDPSAADFPYAWKEMKQTAQQDGKHNHSKHALGFAAWGHNNGDEHGIQSNAKRHTDGFWQGVADKRPQRCSAAPAYIWRKINPIK